jgi:deoxycytidylate deaminase
MQKQKFIIGLTGSLGSGCTATADYLAGIGYKCISISGDILEPLAKKHRLSFSTREEKQDFGNHVRKTKTLKEEYEKRLLDLIDCDETDIAIECFRNPLEIKWLRDKYPHFYLIALFASKSERKRRKEEQGETDFDKSDERDQAEKEEEEFGQQVRKCVTRADVVLDNTAPWRHKDDETDFFERKVGLYLKLLKEPVRAPSDNELLMHLAYSVSLKSLCIERQVGAVIADENYRVLSTGYNDVPYSSEPCYDIYSQCYRKIKKKEALQSVCRIIKHCPYCGGDLNFKEELFSSEPKTISDDAFVCNKCGNNLNSILSAGKGLDFCRSLHAEENAILSNPYLADRLRKTDSGLIIFTTTFPCMLCAKQIANSGIKKIIFVEPYPIIESYLIFEENGITVETFEGVKSLSFNWIFRDRDKYIKNSAYRRRIK